MSTARIQELIDGAGKTVTVQRFTGMPPSLSLSAICKASIRGYAPAELVGPIQQNDRELRIAPLDLASAGITPRQGDRVVVDGVAMRVESSRPEYWREEIAFWVLRCRG